MRFTHLLIAGTALVSSAALAGGAQKHSQLQTEQQTQPSAQTEQQTQPSAQTEQQIQPSAQIAPEPKPQAGQGKKKVKQVQAQLASLGHNPGPVDGIAGPKTKAAVKEFQQSKGLQASGRLNTQTLAALQAGPASEQIAMAPSESSSMSSSTAPAPSESSAPQSESSSTPSALPSAMPSSSAAPSGESSAERTAEPASEQPKS